MVIAEVSIIPIGTKTPSVSKYVARAVKTVMQQKKVKYLIDGYGNST